MDKLHITPYDSSLKTVWDGFVDRSLQTNFIFRRDYLEYHADRFHDQSILVFQDRKVVAVLPCDGKEQAIRSHGGLTFGGLLWDERLDLSALSKVFTLTLGYFFEKGFKTLDYKCIPAIYHRQPAEADRYLLFISGAEHISSGVGAAIPLRRWLGFAKGQRQNAERARQSGIIVERGAHVPEFMTLLTEHLSARYGGKPVHTAEELKLLMDRFPENISLHVARQEGTLVGGVVLYKNDAVIRTQYIASSPAGFETGAVSLILEELITNATTSSTEYFDLGTSHVPGPAHEIHHGLLHFKEMLGARIVTYDVFRIDLEKSCRAM